MDLSIIIVGYNNNDLLKRCINSFYDELIKINIISFEVIIIENGFLNRSPDFLTSKSLIKWFYSEKNLGYGKGNNMGFNISNGSSILILNPDIEISAEAINEMLKAHNKKGINVITSCQLIYPDGKKQENRIFSYDHLRNEINKNVFLEKFKISISESFSTAPIGFAGALLMFDKDLIVNSTIFDVCFFMYDEETEFCKRMFKNGIKFNFMENVKAIHQTQGTINDSIWMSRQKAISRMQYIRISFNLLYFLTYLTIVHINILSLFITLPLQKPDSILKTKFNTHLSQYFNYLILIFRSRKEFRIPKYN